MNVHFSPLAAKDVENIGDYIFNDSAQAAVAFINALRLRCEKISVAPKSGVARPELGENVRSIPFGNYLIFYQLEDHAIRIERVLHGARDIGAVFSGKS
jgi:toxin ParE1/3/4